MIKVLHVGSALDGGGVESLLYNYYSNFDKKEIEFDFVVNSKTVGMIEKKFLLQGSKVFHISPKKENILLYIYGFVKVLITEQKYDIIHVHQDHMSFLPLLIAKLANIPVRIAHSHNAHMKRNIYTNQIIKIFKRLTMIFATDYLACSNDAAIELYGKKHTKSKDVLILKNAIQISEYHYDEKTREKVRNSLQVGNEIVVGNIGRLTNQKNQFFLLEIFSSFLKIHSNSVLLLIGDGELKEQLIKKSIELDIQDKVKFLGVRDDVNELLQAMDIFVLPSLYEGLGIVTIEAQAAGLPTLVSENVPDEVAINPHVKHLNLNESSDAWAKEMMILVNTNARCVSLKKLIDAGYNIKDQAILLEQYYIKKISTS